MNSPKELFAAMSGRSSRRLMAAGACVTCLLLASTAQGQDLSSFAILAGSTITNTGLTTITGNIGLSPGTDFPGQADIVLIDGAIHKADAVAVQAKSDLTSAFNVLMGQTSTPLFGNLGDRTLLAGVYSYASDAQLTGVLTLDGDADDIFIIQVGTSLTTASNSVVSLIGDVQPQNVFFVVGASAVLGTSTSFVGQILAGASIALQTSATILCGAALAQTGAVTMDNNTINVCTFSTEPDVIDDILGDDITGNGGSIVDVIKDFVEDGGTLPLSFQLLALLSPTDLADALEQMSGEAGTGIAPSGMQGVDSFLDLLRGGRGDSLDLVTGRDTQPLSGGTVSVMGYAPSPAPAGGDAFASFDAPTPMPRVSDWKVWASSFGGRTTIDGDAVAGTHDRTSADYGVAFGVERHISAGTMFGLAVSGGGTSFDLTDSLGSGRSAILQAAIYARSEFDQAYLAGTLATGYHRVSLDRYLSFAGADHFTADFNATSVAGEIEAGYHFGWFTPYAALRGQSFSTPAYSEVTASGVDTFALDYDASTTTSLRTELGARADWTTDFGDDGTVTFYASAAWAHEARSGDGVTATFQSLPGSPFVVTGATAGADSLLAAAGAQLDLGNGMAIAGSLNGQFFENAQSYGGTAKLSYSF